MKNSPIPYSLASLNTRIKEARIYRKLNFQSDICHQAGISRQVWSLMELGKRVPKMEYIVRIANLLKLDIRYFFIPGARPDDYDLTGLNNRKGNVGN